MLFITSQAIDQNTIDLIYLQLQSNKKKQGEYVRFLVGLQINPVNN